jgi:5-hydroxyisourate hydrolase
MGRLTTHVLDTAQGKPAAHVGLELRALGRDGTPGALLCQTQTNEDGRTDAPLLEGADLHAGRYELTFALGDYFAGQPLAVADPAFLDRVPVRFGVSDPDAHYHVPLLASPWAYSTYRGS